MKYLTSILLLSLTLIACNNKKTDNNDEPEATVKKEAVVKEFGFVLNDFKVERDTIKNGDTFGAILQKEGYNASEIHNITQEIKDTFNLRDIRVGKPYTLLKSKTAPHKLQAFIYQADRLGYYVVDVRDSVAKAYKKSRPVTVRRRVIAGEIEGSLYETLDNAGAGPALTEKLSGIFAWSVDFFRIQKGDKFAVTVNERFIADSIYAGIDNIEAAFFEYKGDKIYAFPFKQGDDGVSYYNEEGKALKSMFLKAPLKFSHITSRFSPRRFHPVQHRWKAHNGTDYAAPTGTPIMTTATGVVIASAYTSGNGNYVKVRHNSTYTTQYLHMSKRLVKVGQHVQQGDIIGLVGSTGLATGPHVCYRFWKNGVQVDALKQKFTASEPLKAKYKDAFNAQMKPLKKELDSIMDITFKK